MGHIVSSFDFFDSLTLNQSRDNLAFPFFEFTPLYRLYQLLPIETDKELRIVETILKEFQNEVNNEE